MKSWTRKKRRMKRKKRRKKEERGNSVGRSWLWEDIGFSFLFYLLPFQVPWEFLKIKCNNKISRESQGSICFFMTLLFRTLQTWCLNTTSFLPCSSTAPLWTPVELCTGPSAHCSDWSLSLCLALLGSRVYCFAPNTVQLNVISPAQALEGQDVLGVLWFWWSRDSKTRPSFDQGHRTRSYLFLAWGSSHWAITLT